MDGQEIPAEGIGQNAGTVENTAPTATADTNEGVSGEAASTSTPSQPSEPKPAKPDLASLLGDPEARQFLLKDKEFRREFFKDPETQAEMEHRIASEAGRRAKDHFDRLEQQRAREAERQRLLSMDEYELGAEQKRRLAEQLEEETLQQRVNPILAQQIAEKETVLYRELGQGAFGTFLKKGQEAGLSEQEMAKLHPQNYNSYEEYLAKSVDLLADRIAEKRAKPLVKTEAAAMLEERLSAERDSSPSPTVLPAGEGSSFGNANDVHLAYINGQFGRQDDSGARRRYRDALSQFGQSPDI